MSKSEDEIGDLARVIAEEITRQEPRAVDLSQGALTEFMVFGPLNLCALAAKVLSRRGKPLGAF